MKTVKLQLLSVCIFVGIFVSMSPSTASAATILWQSANTDIILGKPYAELEFDNPLAGTEMINQYAVKEWRDASYAFGTPPWYDDWSVNDPLGIDGYFNEIWMRQSGHSIWTTTTVASTVVSVHLNGDHNDGVADVLVDGTLVARIDMGSPFAPQTALIIVKGLTPTQHHIQINDVGMGPSGLGTDVATLGAAALERHIKWSQPPKPTETDNLYYGWNEISEYDGEQIVADDWLCDNDDPVTAIYWWGSYKGYNIVHPPMLLPSSFHIAIWTDIPDPTPDDPNTFSHPNEVVWEIECFNFESGFAGWDYDPLTNCLETCYFFEQYLTEAEYFYQRTNPDGTPAIYWISIAAQYPDGSIVDNPWGWKARPRMFNDDAVQIRVPTTPHIGDQYVEGKPIYWPDETQSWDMAFELTSIHVEPTIKWEQPPNPELPGIHCHDTQDAAGNYSSITIADDWQCHGGEVTDLHWYGNYEREMRGSGIDHFHLSIHKPDPASYCLPDMFESWGIDVPFTAVTETDTGLVNLEGSIIYLYEYDLPDPFPQELDNNYWLDITAFAVDPMDPPLWRWQEAQRGTPSILCGAATRTEPPIPGPWQTILWSVDPERYSDMAFAITSIIAPEIYVKWSQPPEPYEPEAYDGWNEYSVYNSTRHIAADDWYCDTADPVTDIHWWGSFIMWPCEEPPEMPESFHIAIWTDVPAGVDQPFSHPGVVIWETVCNNFTYEFAGWDIQPNPLYSPQACFKFEQDLPEEEWFYQKPGGNIYWISIAANYPAGAEPQYPWGWQTRPRNPQSPAPDDAVRIRIPTNPTLGSPYIDGEPIFWPDEENSWDLAFELTTKEIPPKPPVPNLKWSQPPIEIDPGGQPAPYKLYATTFQAPDQLLSVDPTTGAGTLIGNMSTIFPFGLADRGTELYTFDSFDANSIVKIDPATGNTLQKISINPPGITGEGGLAFRSDGLGFLTSAFGAAGQLWSFDIATASSTYIGPVSPSMDGLDFNGSDVLYAIDQGLFTAALPYDLYTIDQTSGATTLVGSTGVTVTGSVAGLTFAPDGTLFAAMNDELYTIDPTTAAATLVGPIGFLGVSGLTALPVATEQTMPVYCGWDQPSYAYTPPGAPALIKAVADDYRCIGSMPVTSVHWWGSYLDWDNSNLPPTLPQSWIITFWSNVPAGAVADFSYPETLLWQTPPIPADRVKVEMVGRDEFPPNPEINPETCFQYYVDLKEDEIFWQNEYLEMTQENIFWISIVAVYPDTAEIEHPWGWKTRPRHWMDDAVTFNIDGEIMPNMTLHPDIIDPIDYQGESYDMAFELDTDPNYVKWEQPFTGIRRWPHYEDEESMATMVTTTEVATKWLQKPDLTDMGVDVDATLDLIEHYPPQLLADDYKCDTTEPITGINIYGSWWHDDLPTLPDGMTDPRNVQFTLSFHQDIPAEDSPTGYSMPGDVEWWRQFDAGDFGVEMLPDEVRESYYMPYTGIYDPLDHWSVWKYSFSVPTSEAFVQRGTTDEPVIYWLDVQAQPLDVLQDPNVRFGWKTSQEHWNDDATFAIGREPYAGDWEELIYPPEHPYGGESIDLAFELTAERVNTEFNIKRLVADDWKCERRTPVTAVVWWGSYIGYEYKPCYDQIMDPPVKPDYFWLAVWTDVPADEDSDVPFSHPNEIIWEYNAYDYDEVLVGFDKHPISTPGTDPLGREPVFRYSVRLPQDERFVQKDVNDIYWLSVVAVYKDPLSISQPWGWTNHPHVFNDDAVAGHLDPAAGVWSWEELLDQVDNSEDMSFMLFTDPDECYTCADYNSDNIINFLDYADFADDWNWSGPPGGYNNSDLNCNGIVDYNDLNIFTLQWLSSCP
jgi:hypothetical protein